MPEQVRSRKSSLPPFQISKGSLQGISPRELTKLKKAIDDQWRKDNPASTRSPGRPSVRDHVEAACERIKRKMLRRKKATLNDWYDAVREDSLSHSISISRPPIIKFTRDWLTTHIPLADLPEELGAYCIKSQKGFEDVYLVLVWVELWRELPEVQRWLKDYQSSNGALPGELPHKILPRTIQDNINRRLDFPLLDPRCYDGFVRKALRNARAQTSAGARYPIVIRSALGTRPDK